MRTLLCHEGWGAIEDRAQLAAQLIELALSYCPTLTVARIAIAGKNKEISRPVSEIAAAVAALDASWSVTIFDPAGRLKNAPFLISDTYFVLTMFRDLRALYFFGDNLDYLLATKFDPQLIKDLVKISGPGLGYCESFAGPIEAAEYSQELRIASSKSELRGLLQAPSGLSWQSYLPGSSLCVARNLFPVNIWPKQLFDRIRRDTSVFDLMISRGVEITELSDEAVLAQIPQASVGILKTHMRQYLFEQRSPEVLRA
jgi:hypothetical protein